MGLIFSDIPELEGTNTEIALTNLDSLEEELSRAFEKRLSHISELSRAIINDGGDIDLIKSIILSIRSDGGVDRDKVLSDNVHALVAIFSGISLTERLLIFQQIFNEIPSEKYRFTDRTNDISNDAIGRIAYVKNSYNDMVFAHFSSVLNDARASYYGDIGDMCESVINNVCQFCILPLETSRDGKLISFYELTIKYGLKINAEYDIYSDDSQGYTRYALLSKWGVPSTELKKTKKYCDYLEIAYSDTDNISLSDIILAASFFGLELESADTLILNGNDKKIFCMVLRSKNADIKTFLTYLSVDCPDMIFLGYYQRIKKYKL